MLKFTLILFVIISLMMALTIYLLRYCLEDEKLKKYSIGILWFNTFSIFAMSLGYSVFKDMLIAKYSIWLVTIAFMSQITFDIFMLVTIAGKVIKTKLLDDNDNTIDENKRIFIKGAACFPVAALGSSLYASLFERKNTVVNNINIPVDNLSGDLHGCTIAQLSDIHLGPFMDLDDLRELMEKAASTKAQLLAITGDLFDHNAMNFAAAKLVNEYTNKFPYGIYYCYGNHEHLRGINLIEVALSQTDIHVLVNNNETVKVGNSELYLAGVDYPMNKEKFEEHQEIFTNKALENIPENAVTILLAHHPDFFDSAVKRNVNLVLSGHTHGGQIGIMGVPVVPPVFKYMRGLYQQGKSYCYVHAGNGSWFPYRFGCPPEIAVFKLEG